MRESMAGWHRVYTAMHAGQYLVTLCVRGMLPISECLPLFILQDSPRLSRARRNQSVITRSSICRSPCGLRKLGFGFGVVVFGCSAPTARLLHCFTRVQPNATQRSSNTEGRIIRGTTMQACMRLGRQSRAHRQGCKPFQRAASRPVSTWRCDQQAAGVSTRAMTGAADAAWTAPLPTRGCATCIPNAAMSMSLGLRSCCFGVQAAGMHNACTMHACTDAIDSHLVTNLHHAHITEPAGLPRRGTCTARTHMHACMHTCRGAALR
jgi:hypothetical protein